MQIKKVLVTGGLGFIGSAMVRFLLQNPHFTGTVINLDLMTYAANPESLENYQTDPRYLFVHGDIRDQNLVEQLLSQGVDVIFHFAAETHVDRSILDPFIFLETNVKGTLALLEAVRKFPSVHFHHVSTDEVYGSLGKEGMFSENSPYAPNSPYSASKASSDHFVRAFARTYGISMTISHCSNNYGPYQFPEKLIPLMISRCLAKEPLPIYGKGENVRDWLYVEDHVAAIWQIVQFGRKGETYDIGGGFEISNLSLVHALIDLIAQKTGEDPGLLRSLIRFVPDRLGHDFRYAIDHTKIKTYLGWAPQFSFGKGLELTVSHYIPALTLKRSFM